ncbi:MAG: T9SS type A sorting domain-containing protein [Ignavibacteriales bacterium]|nr:T9SS type A sorting domain-containing protein [Ignavibacteriales bacterium]
MRKSLLLLILVLGCISTTYGQLLLVENFDNPVYVVGTKLDTTYWKMHQTGVEDTVALGLAYAGYPGSGIGNSVKTALGGTADYNRTFAAQTSGNVYSFFMVNVSAATTGGDYFFHYSSNPFNGGSTGIRGRVFAKGNATSDSLGFGLSFGSSSTYAGLNYKFNTTYLLAFKIKVSPGASDDTVSLYIFSAPALPTTEPATPTIGPWGDAATTDNVGGPGSVAMRQGSSNTPTLRVDGIRVATSWNAALTTSVASPDVRPTSYSLSQNFPNPFNPSTNFAYEIVKEGFVSVKIYDVLGQVAATLVNEYKPAGAYRATWNAAGFNSGIYFCRIQTGSFTETKKMILVK